MNLEEIEERFTQQTQNRYKKNVQNQYKTNFRRLFYEERLEKYSRRQLASPKGKELILDHLNNHITRPSVAMTNAALCLVWEKGIGLPWPLDLKNDFGKLPKTERRFTLPDSIIKEWAEVMSRKMDVYLKLIWLLSPNSAGGPAIPLV